MKSYWIAGLLIFSVLLAGCQAFLEDYSYQPLGSVSSGGY